MTIGELILIGFLIFMGMGCFFMVYCMTEPFKYKVMGAEKYVFGVVFIILGIILFAMAIDLYFYFNEGVHYIRIFWETEV